jgi:hypothetical protein
VALAGCLRTGLEAVFFAFLATGFGVEGFLETEVCFLTALFLAMVVKGWWK